MLAAQPPRRTSRSSTRNETLSLSSWSTTRESENLPGKVIRWSVAMQPAISSDMLPNTTGRYPLVYPKVTHSVAFISQLALVVLPSAEPSTPRELALDYPHVGTHLPLPPPRPPSDRS